MQGAEARQQVSSWNARGMHAATRRARHSVGVHGGCWGVGKDTRTGLAMCTVSIYLLNPAHLEATCSAFYFP